jgi:hypothetical protein
MDLADKGQAYKALLNAKEDHDWMMENHDSDAPEHQHAIIGMGGLSTTQKHLDDAFERFADLHRDPATGKVDTNELQASRAYFDAHIAKGKNL